MSATTETTTPATEPNNEPNNEPTILNKLLQEKDGIFAKVTDAFKDAFKIAVENNGNCGNCRDFGDFGDRENCWDFVFTIPACSM